ncbi:MAG TPA: M23 family metallopeptidase [Candidatus Xenobia bacterium]|jgi:murein DD-endopeptidase MepM/ murein hydrolase activator NlpD
MYRLCLLVLCLLLSSVAWADPVVEVLGTARQGNPIFVTVTGVDEGTTGEVQWDGRTFELSPADHEGRLRTVLAVPVEMKAGLHRLVLDLGNYHHLSKFITVSSRWFPTQDITLPASTLAGYDTPRNKADDQKIIAELENFDPRQRWQGSFSYPVRARESTGFGDRRLYNGWKTGWHKGLDLAAADGAPIHAPANGIVLLATRGLVNGNTLVLQHGLGLGTVYLHMSSFKVHVGDTVRKGQIIGYVGGTGGFAPHLHWEARVNGVPIDPHALLELPAAWQ